MQILQKDSKKEEKETKPSFFNLLLVIVMNNSYSLALFMLFWIGFYTINILHLIFVSIFLVFLQNRARLITINIEQKTYLMLFAYKYWFILIVYTSFYILTKFIYQMVSKNNISTSTLQIIEFIGINYDYQIDFSIGFYGKDFASLTILWVAFIIFSIQQDTYRSKIYIEY